MEINNGEVKKFFCEHRPISKQFGEPHSSYTGRFLGHFGRYDYTNPAHWGAALVHGVSQLGGLDPALRDASRWIDGDRTPIQSLERWGRVSEDITFHQHLRRREYFSAVTKLSNLIGDTLADAADDVTIH